MSWAEVRAIQDRFAALNPYDPAAVSDSVLKIEKDNFDPAKRYALFVLDSDSNPVLLRKNVNNHEDRSVRRRENYSRTFFEGWASPPLRDRVTHQIVGSIALKAPAIRRRVCKAAAAATTFDPSMVRIRPSRFTIRPSIITVSTFAG